MDTISDETIVKLIDETLTAEKNAKANKIRFLALRIVSAAAAIVFIMGFVNVLPIFLNNPGMGFPGAVVNAVIGTRAPDSAEDLDFAFFDLIRQENTAVNIGLNGLVMRFNGIFNSIDADDFTDMILTKDGIPVENDLIYHGRFRQGFWYGQVTDFYFEFEDGSREPGQYGLTGKYKGVDLKVQQKIVEEYPVGDTPANPADLRSIGYGGMGDGTRTGTMLLSLTEISFNFAGRQEAFYMSDLTDLKLTDLTGAEIEFEFTDRVVRYLEVVDGCYGESGEVFTKFHLILEKPIERRGKYIFSGKYRGEPFESAEMRVLWDYWD